MKLHFKQRMFSWFGSYDVWNEAGETVYTVKGVFSWGHCLKVYDPVGREVATLNEKLLSFAPRFELYCENRYVGSIEKEITFFKPKFHIDFNGWRVEGNLLEWDYTILNPMGEVVATITKKIFNWTDTYSIDVARREDALYTLMLVIAIDAEKCSRQNN